MFQNLLYLLAFVLGTFVVWQLGRRQYYDEEKLIDLVVFSTAVGVAAFWGIGGIGELWGEQALDGGNFLVGAGQVPAAVLAAVGFAGFYLKRLHWPLWPSLGFLLVGASASGLLVSILYSTFYILAFALTLAASSYIVVFNGDEHMRNFVSGLKAGFYGRRENSSTISSASRRDRTPTGRT